MKLHLPTRLRAAVLACFAVVTSFSTTLATGAIVGGAFAVAIAGSQALAAYDATNAVLSGSDNPGIFGTASNQTPVTVPDGKTLTFAMENTNTTNWFVNSTYNADILIDGGDDGSTGMCITNGGSGTMTFAGSVTGDGLLSKTGAGTDMTLAFTGNVSNFSGGIDLGSTSDRFVLRFSSTNVSSSEKGVSGIGDISFKTAKNTLEYNYSGGSTVYVTNAIAKDGGTSKVKLSGTDAVVFTKSVTIDELTSSASSITFAGGSATLIGTFNLANAALGTAPAVQGTGEFNLANNILVELGDISRLQLNQEYVVFGEDITVSGWDSLTMDRFTVQGVRIGSRTQYTLSEKGITFTDYGAVYTDMSTAGTQNWNYTDTIWNTSQDSSDSPIAFAAGDSAIFTADAVLTVQNDGVEVTGLTVSGEGTEVSLTGGYIVVRDEVVVGNGAKLSLNTKTNATGYLRGEVTVQNGGTLQFNAKDVTGYTNNNTHTININEGGKLVMNIQDTTDGVNETFRGTLNLDGTLEGNGRWDLYGGSAKIVTGDGKNASISTNLQLRQNDSAITVGSNSTLTVSGTLGSGSEGNGKLIKNGAGTLKFTDGALNGGIGYKLSGGNLLFTNGGALGSIEIAANDTNLQFTGSGKTYTTGAISTTTNNYFARNIRVDSGVTVTVAANSDGRALVNSWGMGVLTADGTLNLEGNLYMHTGGNNSTTNNLITGTGVVNVASLTTSNGGTYNFSVNALNVSGYAEFGQYTNFLGGTANLNGTSGFFIRTNIEGGTLNLVGAFKSNNNGVINVNSGALNFKGVTAEGFDNTLQVLNVAKGAAVTVDTGAVATIASATIAAPIVNKGNLTLSGTLTVSDLSGFTPTVNGSLTYVDAEGNPSENGYLSGERAYTLIENTGTLNDDAITAVSGVAGTYADGVLTSTSTDESVFYVNTTVDSVALGEGKKYYINGGTLNVTTDAYNILSTAEGTTGTIKITETGMATGNTNLTTVFEGKLELASGIAFTLGKAEAGSGGDGKVIDVDSFSSVILNNGSTLNYQGNGNTTIKNFTVKEGTANLYYIDANGDNAVQMVGVTTLNGHLNFTTQYDGAVAFERLTGVGNLTSVAASGASEEFRLSVQSLQGYKGAISLTKGGSTYEATISTGSTEAVSFKGISVTNAMTLNLNVEAATTMTEGLSLSNGATVSATAATGGSLSTALVVNENRVENSRSNSVFRYTGSDLSIRDITLNNTARLEADFDADSLSIKVGNDTRLKAANNRTLTVTSLSAVAGSDNSFLTIGGNGKVYLNGSGSIESLGIGAWNTSPVVDLNGTYTVGRLRMSEEGTSGLNLNAGSTLNVTGTINNNSTSRSLLLAHWGHASTLVQDGGTLNATGAVMYTGWTGAGTYQAKSGTATLKGISFRAQDWGGNNYRGAFLLGDESGGSARVNIGSEGIYGINNGASGAEVTVKLGNGTLGAYADWTMGYDAGRTAIDVQLIGANGGTIIDTGDITDSNVGHTITINSSLVGSGKLVKTGVGTLKLAAANTYSGGTSLNGGTLEVAAEAALGSGSLSITGGTLDVTENVTLGNTVSTTVSGGSLKASHTSGWTLTGASVGNAAADANSAGMVTLTNTTITGNITGNDKLVMSGTANATANATVSGVSVGGITVTSTDANKLTLNNATIGSAITNNGALVLSGTQNVTLDGANTTHYADIYGGSTFGDNGYKSSQDVYTLVSGAAATAATGTTWQIDGSTVANSALTNVSFDGKNLTVIQVSDTAGKVYYINSDTVEYKTGAGCYAAEKLQLVGGKLVMSEELDSTVTTGGIAVTGSSTTLELNTELAADKLSLGTGAATVLVGNGTLNLGTGTSLASGITMGTATDAKWTGTVKVSGAALTDANLSGLGISGSTIELDDTDGSLKGGTYAAAVLLTNGSELTLGADNAFNGGLDATNGTLKIAGKNSISTLTLADSATLGIDLTSMGLDSLLNMGDEALLTIGTLNVGTAGGALNLSALISSDLLLTMSNGQSITLADIATNNATLGLLLDSGNGTPAESLVMSDDNGYQYTYTLAQDDTTGHTVVKVSAKLYQNGWIGDETDVWTTTDSLAGADANWEGSIGLFAGYGSGTVNIDAAGVDASAKTVMVSAAEHTTDYTFEGGALVADKLVVNAGSLTINNEGVETLSTTVVSGEGSLTVNTGKELTVGTDMAVLNEAKFTNKGETTIIGTLTVAQDATVTNSRNLSVGGVSAEEATISSTGQLTIGADGGTISALTGNGYLNNSGELTIKSDTDLQTLTNAGTLTVEGALKVTATATGGVIKAASADLGYAKLAELQVTGAVTAKELTVDKATMESLTADKLASLAGDTVTVTNDASLGTFSVNGVLEVGGKLTVSDAVESEGEILAAEADLQSDATLDTLKVTGGLNATNLSVTTLEAASLDAESLTITDGGTGTVQSGVTLDKFSGSGSFSVLGDLTVNSTVAQGGTVQADNITVAGSAVFADVTTGSLTADAVSLTNGSITTLNTEHLTVHGTVSVSDDVRLASLGGMGALQVDSKLSLTEQITSSANVAAGILELQASGSTLGSVLADTLAVAEGLTLSTTDALLTVDNFRVLNASEVAISLSESVFAALDKEASGLYSIADYLIIDGVASADIFSLTDCSGLDALRAAGRDATLSVSKGNLYLSITAAMDEEGEEIGLVWDATGGNTTTSTGSEIDTEDGFYKALDYVQQVLVKDDTTFDLTTDAVGDAEPGNTSKPELGLTVRNLRGGGELTIKGNSAAQDVASLFNTDGKVTSAAEAVGLTVDASRVNLGLPADSDGIMDDDFGAESPTLASLSLVNGALVDVNADTEVLGDTDLADTSALQVAEGSILTTHMLSGTDKASVSGAIRVTKGGVYTGSGENAEIIASGGSDLRLRTGGRKGMSLLAENGSKVTLDSAGQDGSMKSLRVGGASMARMAGSSTLNLLNTTTTDKGIVHNTLSLTDTEGNYISNTAVTLSLGLTETAGTLGTADAPVVIDGAADVTGSSITVNMLGNGVKNGVLDIATGDVANLKLAQLVTGGTVEGNNVVLTGTPEIQTLLAKYYTNARLEKDGAITVDRVTDYYSANLKLSENAQTGAAMADVALLQVNPQAKRDEYKDLAGVLDSLDAAVVAGNNAAADSLGAAVSGASVAALGAAVAGDVERQLMALRNRTTTMGVDQNSPNLDMPYFNAWINAEGDFRRMDEDGTAAGYELNSWGGTVGFDVDMTPNFTVGLAATAMYGDFTAKSADHAEGDMDTYYLTTFARFAAHRWSHTFVATVGMADTSLKRTVAHANGSYSAEGDTDALSFGFLYEVGYVAAMNESATACLQPVFNVMLSHSCLNGYKETGSDAALSTGDVEMTTVTFGLGARTQAQVGTGTLNRATLLEGRALVKLRAGDREAEAENALGLIPGATGSVVGAEKGVVGMELGVGITIPVGSESGSVFADASLEVGGGYTNINGTVGYRINF